jgi:hypothetical protein
MARIDLDVPYVDKDQVKIWGARWDPAKRVWYVPEGVDPRPLAAWFPIQQDDGFCVRADHYYIGQTNKSCWKCHKQTAVFGFLLDKGHDVLTDYDCPNSGRYVQFWEHVEVPATLDYVSHLPDAMQKRMASLTADFYPDRSNMASSTYWINHCEWCGAKQGDFYIHEEPGPGGFVPVCVKEASKITLYRVDEPLKLMSCGHGAPVHYFESMKRVPFDRRPGAWGRRLRRFLVKS